MRFMENSRQRYEKILELCCWVSLVFFIFVASLEEKVPMKVELKDGSVLARGRRLIEGLSFVAHGGEVVCIVGGRGSGKTLLLRALMGMWPLEGGVASVDGAVVTPRSAPYLRKEMGYVPQDWPRDAYKDIVELTEEVVARRRPIAFLDEPLTGQDDATRQAVLQAVRKMAGEGTAVVLTCSKDDRLVGHVQGLSESQMSFKFVELWKYQSSDSV
jgi:ABC-type cobalamin/Fe3+-siderophores transport system ATPase subunit